MGNRARNMNAFNAYDDLVEHLYGKEIFYVTSETLPDKVELRDIFRVNSSLNTDKALMYIQNAAGVKGFVEIDFCTPSDNTFISADTQEAALSYLASWLNS